MLNREWWRWWWSRFHDRLNPRGTWITVVTFLAGGAMAVATQIPGIGLWSLWGGLALLIAPLSYIGLLAWLAYPPRLNTQQALGRKHTLTELQKLPPTCVKVALVGVGLVGKTTLLDHLAGLGPTNAQTYAPELAVHHAPEPVGLLAYLDAAGEDLTQQFEIVDHADFLVLLLDHNSGYNTTVSIDRKSQQGHNVNQLVAKIRRRCSEGKPVLAVHVLRNKHDLWSQCPGPQKTNLDSWFAEQVEKVRKAMPAGMVSEDDHSNERSGDIAKVRIRIMELAQLVVKQRQV